MRTEFITENTTDVSYGYIQGEEVIKEFKCPCGKGKIIEEHDNVPGFREHTVDIFCPECKTKYRLDTHMGVSQWQLVPIV